MILGPKGFNLYFLAAFSERNGDTRDSVTFLSPQGVSKFASWSSVVSTSIAYAELSPLPTPLVIVHGQLGGDRPRVDWRTPCAVIAIH